MKNLKDFYEEKKNDVKVLASNKKIRQETLNKFIPRLKKLKESDYFRDEWAEWTAKA